MKIKVGDKLPNSELFYLDKNNDVKKFHILDLLLQSSGNMDILLKKL